MFDLCRVLRLFLQLSTLRSNSPHTPLAGTHINTGRPDFPVCPSYFNFESGHRHHQATPGIWWRRKKRAAAAIAALQFTIICTWQIIMRRGKNLVASVVTKWQSLDLRPRAHSTELKISFCSAHTHILIFRLSPFGVNLIEETESAFGLLRDTFSFSRSR